MSDTGSRTMTREEIATAIRDGATHKDRSLDDGFEWYASAYEMADVIFASGLGVGSQDPVTDALNTALLAVSSAPCVNQDEHERDLRFAFGPDGSFAAEYG